MPGPQTYSRTTPFGTQHGLVTPGDEMEYRRQMANDNLQAQAQMEALRGQTMRDVQGTYGQRSASDMAMQTLRGTQRMSELGMEGQNTLANTRAGNEPAMGAQQFAREKWQHGLPVEDAEAQMRIRGMQRDQEMQDAIFNPSAPAGSGAPQKPAGFSYGLPSASEAAGLSLDGGSPPSPANAAAISTLKGGGPDQSMLDRVAAYRFYKGGEDPRIAAQKAALAGFELNKAQRQDSEGQRTETMQREADLASVGKYEEANALEQQTGVHRQGVSMTGAGDPQNGELQIAMKQMEQAIHGVVSAASNDVPPSTAINLIQALREKAKLIGGMTPTQIEGWIQAHIDRATQFSPNISSRGRYDNTNMIREAAGLPPIAPGHWDQTPR